MCLYREMVIMSRGSVGVSETRERWVFVYICV